MTLSRQQAERRDWLGILARAPEAALEDWARASSLPRYTWLRRPETGLAMVRARTGGTGAKFNAGEMTVTRCALKLEGGTVGVAYVQGRSARKAELVAMADALLQGDASLLESLVKALKARQLKGKQTLHRQAQSTRVEFFTLARGEFR